MDFTPSSTRNRGLPGGSRGFIDTHCHLDAAEFDSDRKEWVQAARQKGVTQIVIPAVGVGNFARVAALAHTIDGAGYGLGIHPLQTLAAEDDDLGRLDAALQSALADSRLVAIGEIGLDFFVEAFKTEAARIRQEWFYREQLKLARRYGLPVLLHVRRSQDRVLKGLREIGVAGGIAHAFNGSPQQAAAFVALDFRLGFGGAMTYERARNIRRLAESVPSHSLVLETDAPDMAPAWCKGSKNTPAELPAIGNVLATLRKWTRDELAQVTCENAYAALPRLAQLA